MYVKNTAPEQCKIALKILTFFLFVQSNHSLDRKKIYDPKKCFTPAFAIDIANNWSTYAVFKYIQIQS